MRCTHEKCLTNVKYLHSTDKKQKLIIFEKIFDSFAVQIEKCERIYSSADDSKRTMNISQMYAHNVKIHWQLFQRVCYFIAWILYVHLLIALFIGRSLGWEIKVEQGWVTADNARLIIEEQLWPNSFLERLVSHYTLCFSNIMHAITKTGHTGAL